MKIYEVIQDFDLNGNLNNAIWSLLSYDRNGPTPKSAIILLNCISWIQIEIDEERNKKSTMHKIDHERENADMINNPWHYKGKRFSAIDVIMFYKLNFPLGSCFKYVVRCEKKGKKIEDLEKAIKNVEFEFREIEQEKNEASK